jgi:autotransporter-associated beta strand protein
MLPFRLLRFRPVRVVAKKRQAQLLYYPHTEILEDRLAPATFAWTGQGGGGIFSNPANWNNVATNTPGTPGNGDSLVFPLNGPSAPGTVTDDLLTVTSFNSITFLSSGWTVAASPGVTVGISGSINDTTNIAGQSTFTAPLSFAAASSSVGINVVNPPGAINNQIVLNGAVNLGTAGLTYTGFGNLNINGAVNGSGSIVANGSNNLTLNAANSYTGGTTINSGIVGVTNATGLGTGTVTVNNGGTLQLGFNGVSNALNLNGFGFGGNGALIFNSGFTYDGAITLQTTSSINVGGNAGAAIAGAGGNTTGSISGPGGLTVVGNNFGFLNDNDTGTYTGVTNLIGANLVLTSPAAGQNGGVNTGTTGYVVSQGAELELQNGPQQVNNRIGANAFVELDGGFIICTGAAAVENFATLDLGNVAPGIIGSNAIQLGGFNTQFTVGTLNRFPGSTVTFTGPNIGTANEFIKFTTLGTGAALVNGILPFADVGATAPATDFATQGANGIAIAASTVTPVLQGGLAVGNGLDNLKLTAPLSLVGDTFINSLNTNSQSVTLNGHRLIIGSGGLLQTALTLSTISTGELDFGTTPNAQAGNPTVTPFPVDASLTAVEGIITVASPTGLTLSSTPILVGNNLTFNLNPTGSNGQMTINGTPANSAYTGVTWVTSGTLFLGAAAAADAIPTPLVIGDNTGGALADQVVLNSNFQQIGTAAAPGNVTINSSGNFVLNAGDNQSVGNLTFNSGLNEAQVNTAAALTVTGTVTSGGVVLSPTAGLPGGIPDVSFFNPSAFHGTGTLILAPGGVASGTTIFNVAKTPDVFNGVEEDLHIAVAIGAGSATLDKQGAGVLVAFVLPQVAYTGIVQIDAGTFASGVVGFAQNITVNAGGTLGNESVAGGSTTSAITVNGGTVNPGLPPSPLAPSNSQNGLYLNTGTATTPNFSAGGILDLHVDGFGTTTDWDQFEGTNGANQVTLGGTSIIDVDLLGLAQWGTLTGKVINGVGASPFIWSNPLIGKFSNAPNTTLNILPAANVLNNPTGFQAIVSYGGGFITLTLAHPSTVANSSYTTTQNTALAVSTQAAGVLANVTNPDFIGSVSEATAATVMNPGTYTGSAGGTLVVNANGTFTYTPKAGFIGTETFSLTATDPRGTQSAAFTVTFTVGSATPPMPPTPPTPPPSPPTANKYFAIGAGAGGGPQVNVYNAATGALVSSFFAFTPTFSGGVRVAVADVNGDGTSDIICAAGPGGGPQVIVIDGTKLTQLQSNGQIAGSAVLGSFYAFTPSFAGGVYVAAAVSSTGQAEIVVGAGAGGGPQVEVIDATKIKQVADNGQIASTALLANFFPFTATFAGGVRVALGDVNGDGVLDVIAGAGPGGGSQVVVADGTKLGQVAANGQVANTALLASFYAFLPTFTGGVFVSAGNTLGTAQINLILGADAGAGPQVEVVNGSQVNQLQSNGQIANSAVLSNFFALPSSFSGGVAVGFNGAFGSKSQPALLTAAGSGGSPEVSIFNALTGQSLSAFFALPAGFSGGTYVSG